jgi:hypothetical protein
VLEAGGPRAHAEPAVIVGFLPGFTVEILLMLPNERARQTRRSGQPGTARQGATNRNRPKSTHEQVEISVERSSLWAIFQWIFGWKIWGGTQGCRANGS